MNITQQAIYSLDYRFHGESEVRKLAGTQKEIEQFLDDFTFSSANKILTSPYLRRKEHAQVSKFPLGSLSYHLVWPAKEQEPIKAVEIPSKGIPTNKLAKQLTKQFDILRHKANREHEICFIHLMPQTTVTCVETGISYSVSLPVPDRVNLEVMHPLGFFSNCQEVIRIYAKHGIKLESELSQQVLAGMLLTILRHKKLLVCHDYVQANICLQKAKPDSLSFCVRFFNSLPSSLGLPQLHLIPEAIYDFHHAPVSLTKEQIIADRVELMLQNFVKVCKGESESENKIAGTILRTKQDKAKVRVYGGNSDIEARQAASREKLGKQLLVKLIQQFPVPYSSQAYYDNLHAKLDAFMFLGTEKRQEIGKQILERFGESKTGRELAALFATTKTETMELSLSSFHQEIQQDIAEFTGKKRKFNLFAKKVTE